MVKRSFRTTLASLVLLSTMTSTYAETLEQVVFDVIENSDDIKQSITDLQLAEEGVKAASSRYTPQLKTTASYAINQTMAEAEENIATNPQPINIEINQPLFNQGIISSVNVAKINQTQASIDLTRAKNKSLIDGATLYLNVLKSQADVIAQMHALDEINQNKKHVEEKVKLGISTPVEASIIKAKQKQAIANAQKAKSDLNIALTDLRKKSQTQSKVFTQMNPNISKVTVAIPDLEAQLAESKTNNLEIQKAKNNLHQAIAGKSLKLSTDGYMPSVTANLSYLPCLASTAIECTKPEITLGVGLQASLDLGIFANTAQENNKIRKAQIALQTVIDETELEITKTYENHTYLKASLEAEEATITSLQEALTVAQAAYKEGGSTITDVLNQISSLAQAKTKLAVHKSNYILNILKLHALNNTLSEKNINALGVFFGNKKIDAEKLLQQKV